MKLLITLAVSITLICITSCKSVSKTSDSRGLIKSNLISSNNIIRSNIIIREGLKLAVYLL